MLCGAAASGNFTWTPEHVAQSALCMVMSGPLLTGYTQTINDYYDREIDAINEPNRPIPSGEARLLCSSRPGHAELCAVQRCKMVVSMVSSYQAFGRIAAACLAPRSHNSRSQEGGKGACREACMIGCHSSIAGGRQALRIC